MALFDTNLEEILGKKADLGADMLQDQAAQKRKRYISREAASGRLGSGVSNYGLTDLDTQEASGIGDIYSGLGESLGQIPSESILNENEFGRKMSLAELIGRLNKRSSLEEALSALGTAGQIGGTVASFL